jgi:hypothetical protein
VFREQESVLRQTESPVHCGTENHQRPTENKTVIIPLNQTKSEISETVHHIAKPPEKRGIREPWKGEKRKIGTERVKMQSVKFGEKANVCDR